MSSRARPCARPRANFVANRCGGDQFVAMALLVPPSPRPIPTCDDFGFRARFGVKARDGRLDVNARFHGHLPVLSMDFIGERNMSSNEGFGRVVANTEDGSAKANIAAHRRTGREFMRRSCWNQFVKQCGICAMPGLGRKRAVTLSPPWPSSSFANPTRNSDSAEPPGPADKVARRTPLGREVKVFAMGFAPAAFHEARLF